MRKIMAFMRLLRALWVLLREGVFISFPIENFMHVPFFLPFMLRLLAKKTTKQQSRARNLAHAIHRLGPSYIKLGQFLAMRPDLIGKDLANDLSFLHDQMPQFPFQEAVSIIEKTLGGPLENFFVTLEPAIAAASMAQVHPALIQNVNGEIEKVAVKIIRPDVRQRFAKDLESFYLCARLQEFFIPSFRRLRPVSVIDNLAQTTKLELDLRLEASALSEAAENSKHDLGFRVALVDWQRTGRDVLTMEWIEGTKISDLSHLKKEGHNLKKLATNVMQAFLKHSLRDGFFHADMHSGNLFVDNKGDIVALDYGITGRLGQKEQRFLAEILYGFIKRDYYRVAKVHFEAGYVPAHYSIESFAQANRAIGEPIHGQSANSISMAKLLGLLFEITEIFDMQTQPELLLLQKSMVVVEGIARHLDPQFNMWQAAEPIVSNWIAENTGPIGLYKDLQNTIEALKYTLQNAPDLLQKQQQIIENYHKNIQNGFKIDPESLSFLSKKQKQRQLFWILPLWVIALSLLWLNFK